MSLLFLGMVLGSLGRTLHVSDTIQTTMTAVSIVFSLTAAALFVKAAPPQRRPFLLAMMVAVLLAAAAAGYLFLHH